MNTMQENKSATDTVELGNKELIELLEGASTHSSKDKSLQSLNTVQIEGTGEGFTARATDRYRLIEGTLKLDGGQLSKSLLSLSDVKRVIDLAKSNKHSRVTLNRLGDLLTVSVNGSSITVQLLDNSYPDFNDLFTKYEGKSESIDSISFNPALFADYAKIAGKNNPVKVQFNGERYPIVIGLPVTAIAWRALLMPMRTV